MRARLFGLAEIDHETGEPDPEQVWFWGLELPEGRAVMLWHSGGRSHVATFGSASGAARRFGPLYDLGLVYL